MKLSYIRNRIMFSLLKRLFPEALSQAQAVVLVPLESLATFDKSDNPHAHRKSLLRSIQIDLTHPAQHALLLAKFCQGQTVENPIWLPLDFRIYKEFTGDNHLDLSARHNVTLSHVCRAIHATEDALSGKLGFPLNASVYGEPFSLRSSQALSPSQPALPVEPTQLADSTDQDHAGVGQ